jgi:hypothetical protein
MPARFWHNNWLEGQAPRYLAPNLFQLARRKNRSVQQELRNNNWIRSLRGHIASATHIEEFVSLWIRIQDVQLSRAFRTLSPGIGLRMAFTPLVQHTGYNSKAHLLGFVGTKFGKHMQKTSARSSHGS